MARRVSRLGRNFFERDVLEVAPDLIGRVLVRQFEDGSEFRARIVEMEAYRGEEDLACHARFGKTERNKVMYGKAGVVYVYLIYGMYWMLNFVTGKADEPQAVLVRGVEGMIGPGRLGKQLELDGGFYGEDLVKSKRLWVENCNDEKLEIEATNRIGIGYAGEWARKKWRFVAKNC